jgi:vacuolar-type H+-ATPase catalytic subunit A/Vma1
MKWELDNEKIKIGRNINGGELYGIVNENKIVKKKLLLKKSEKGNVK